MGKGRQSAMLSFMTSFMMTTKWATDQSAIRTWPCMNIVIFTHNLGNSPINRTDVEQHALPLQQATIRHRSVMTRRSGHIDVLINHQVLRCTCYRNWVMMRDDRTLRKQTDYVSSICSSTRTISTDHARRFVVAERRRPDNTNLPSARETAALESRKHRRSNRRSPQVGDTRPQPVARRLKPNRDNLPERWRPTRQRATQRRSLRRSPRRRRALPVARLHLQCRRSGWMMTCDRGRQNGRAWTGCVTGYSPTTTSKTRASRQPRPPTLSCRSVWASSSPTTPSHRKWPAAAARYHLSTPCRSTRRQKWRSCLSPPTGCRQTSLLPHLISPFPRWMLDTVRVQHELSTAWILCLIYLTCNCQSFLPKSISFHAVQAPTG